MKTAQKERVVRAHYIFVHIARAGRAFVSAESGQSLCCLHTLKYQSEEMASPEPKVTDKQYKLRTKLYAVHYSFIHGR